MLAPTRWWSLGFGWRWRVADLDRHIAHGTRHTHSTMYILEQLDSFAHISDPRRFSAMTVSQRCHCTCFPGAMRASNVEGRVVHWISR
jgi:hypothetical protein